MWYLINEKQEMFGGSPRNLGMNSSWYPRNDIIIGVNPRTVAKPVVQPVIQPVAKPVVQPVEKPVIQPVVQPVEKPVIQPVVQEEKKVISKTDKDNCPGCGKEFKKITLTKYDGRCNACHRKTVTKNITKKLQLEVWEKRNPNAIRGSCYSCGGNIDIHSFECAHIIAIANGGLTNISNLEPICKMCNRSCGTKDLNIFIESINHKHSGK